MAEQLAAVPEESMDVSTAAYPPRSIYRDRIRTVAVSGMQIRSPLFFHSQSGHNGFSYSSDSGASNSYPSSNSGCSSGSALSAAAADFGVHELKTIARQMASDGYTQRMAQAYHAASLGSQTPSSLAGLEDGDGRFHVLESWFLELDVAWVLQIRPQHGSQSQGQLWLTDKSASSLQDLVQRWIRGLTVTVHSMTEQVFIPHEITRFGVATISKMLVFVDAIVPILKAENIRAVLDMYICVFRAMDNMKHPMACADLELLALSSSLYMPVNKLEKAISSTMEKVRTLIEDDDSWAIEIPRGQGEVHSDTRLIADCITSLVEAEVGWNFVNYMISRIDMNGILSQVTYDTIRYVNELLLRKSELCSDPSLRYLFLLNNSYFVAHLNKPCESGNGWELITFECEKYMYSYLDVSWGHVLSCIPRSHFPGPLHRWINTSSLVKFESAFNKTYQTQKFWKVPDPRLRDVLRRAITERVVSSYRDYLKEHPELAEHVSRGNSTPEVLEEMLSQLFEG